MPIPSHVEIPTARTQSRIMELLKPATWTRRWRPALGTFRSRPWCAMSTIAMRTPCELDVQHFASIVGVGNMVTERESLDSLNTDWTGTHRGRSKLALRPGSTQEVSRILAHCCERKIPIVPQGGNTGLVGGSVPISREVILSLSRMSETCGIRSHAPETTYVGLVSPRGCSDVCTLADAGSNPAHDRFLSAPVLHFHSRVSLCIYCTHCTS